MIQSKSCKLFKTKREGGRDTGGLLQIKGLPTLLYHFLALSDRMADALTVNYLITVHAYRLLLCAMALQTLLSLPHLHETGQYFAELRSCSLSLPPQIAVSPVYLFLRLFCPSSFPNCLALAYFPTNYNQDWLSVIMAPDLNLSGQCR